MNKKPVDAARRILEIGLICLSDIVTIFLIYCAAIYLRQELPHLIYVPELEDPFIRYIYNWWILGIWLFFLYYEGLYTKFLSFWEEVRVLWKVSVLSTLTVFAIITLGKLQDEISRFVILSMGIISIVILPIFRMGIKKILRFAGFLKRRAIILGAGKTGALILNALLKEPNYGFDVRGFLDDNDKIVGQKIKGIKIYGGVKNAVRYVKRRHIHTVIVAMPGLGRDELRSLINDLQFKVENLLFVPDIFGVAVLGTSLHQFFNEGAFAFEVKNNLSSPVNIYLKKYFDIFLSILLLPVLFLAMLVFFILIKIDSKGPALYIHERIGKNGRKIRCYKFRTMYRKSDEILEDLLNHKEEIRDEWNSRQKIKNDPRITRVGKFLRSTSLDELPQILNILKGEMSIVGPRPVTKDEIEKHYKENAELCFSVLPGITGLWQVSGRSDMNYDRRILLDSWYVRNWNVWLDIVIIFKTIKVVLKREGSW